MSCYSFDISYRPGKENVVADSFSRVYCSLVTSDLLYDIHKSLCYPGVTRMTAFFRARNLPYLVEDVRRVTSGCKICAQSKLRFYVPPKGPLLDSNGRNRYILTVIDGYS